MNAAALAKWTAIISEALIFNAKLILCIMPFSWLNNTLDNYWQHETFVLDIGLQSSAQAPVVGD